MANSFLWWRDGIIYQIYPRSFADSNGDGIGDLNGIRGKLDYLQDLGVDAIWLSPIFPTPDADFGYDVADYNAIDPRFGTMEDFRCLLDEAHRRGIRVILDLVLNHTSDQHRWFQESRKSRDNPYRDWYFWRDPAPNGGPPNNWQSRFGGSGWKFDPATGQYYFHMFYPEQPDLNWRNPEVRAAMLDVFRFWLDMGVDGFRLDVFNAYFKHEDLPSNPAKIGLIGWDRQHHRYDHSQPEMKPLIKEIRAILDSYSERYAVGETFENSVQETAAYMGPEGLHAAFNFTFTNCPWRPGRFLKAVLEWEAALQPEDWPNYVLNNHDVVRSATRYGVGEDDERLKVAAAMLLTLRGTPFMYYGEEIGMRNIRLRRSEILDRVGRRYWPFYKGRDGCRAPMQWTGGVNAGFSEGKPWLPVHPDHVFRSVEAQDEQPNSLLNFYRRLIRTRRTEPALRSGLFLPVTYEPRSLLAYLRKTKDQTLLVALNFSRRPNRLVLGGALSGPQWELVLSSSRDHLGAEVRHEIELLGDEALILRQR